MELKTARLTGAGRSGQEEGLRGPVREAGRDPLAGWCAAWSIRDYLAHHGVTYEPSGLEAEEAASPGAERAGRALRKRSAASGVPRRLAPVASA